MVGQFAKVLANLIVLGSGILLRAVSQAYKKALINASKTGVAQETLQDMALKSGKAMSLREARLILGVDEKTPWEEILKVITDDMKMKPENALNPHHSCRSMIICSRGMRDRGASTCNPKSSGPRSSWKLNIGRAREYLKRIFIFSFFFKYAPRCLCGNMKMKVVLVTGASSGLGREFSLAFARDGSYRIVLAARRIQLLESLREEIGENDAKVLELDVSADERAIDAAVEKAWSLFGGLDVLVNNAGVRGEVNSCLDLDEKEWNKVMNTNARGTWLVSKAVARRMVAEKRAGSIINISSTSSVRGLLPSAIAYATSKAAINRITDMMALELGKFNIRVNAIAAGIFRSEITGELLDKSWVHEAATKIVPLKRFGKTTPDITSLVLLLASDSSSYITGALFHVDGGHSLLGLPLWSSL